MATRPGFLNHNLIPPLGVCVQLLLFETGYCIPIKSCGTGQFTYLNYGILP